MNQDESSKKVSSKDIVIHFIASILTLLIIFAIINSFDSSTKNSTPKTCNDYKTEAIVISNKFVESHLKYPGSSHILNQFESSIGFVCTDKQFTINGWVDAANGFNAKERMNYIIQIEWLGGDWADIQNWKENSFSFIGQ